MRRCKDGVSMEPLVSLAHWFGSAVCHQWPAHSYFIDGVELPLCARCTGMYLGAMLTLLYYAWRRPRAVGLPPIWALVVLILFFVLWAGDGVNSFIATIPVGTPLYPPQNILRLATGALMGITLGTLISMLFNSLIWREVKSEPILSGPRDLFVLLALQAVLVLLVNSQQPLLLYPLTFATLVSILVLNGGLMSAMAASLMRRLAGNWREAFAPLTAGLLVALTYLDAFAFLRYLMGVWLGTPI